MLKKRSKTLSIVMSLCLCLALLAPVFVAPQAADAGSAISYSAANTITVKTKSDLQPVDIKILIDIPEAAVIDNVYASYFSVKLPSGAEFAKDISTDNKDAGKVTLEEVKADLLNDTIDMTRVSGSTIDFSVTKKEATSSGDTKMLLTISKLKVKSGSGDFNIEISAPSGSAFPSGTVTVGKIVGSGGTNTWVSSVKEMGEADCQLSDVIIEETIPSLENGEKIKLSLAKGFEWVKPITATATGGWGFSGTVGNIEWDNERDLVLTLGDVVTGKPGKIQITGLKITTTSSANHGEVELSVSSNKDNVTDQDIVVAKYADFGVSVTEGSKEDVTAGREKQEIGNFFIKEAVGGSLLQNRSIKLELPDGVEWTDKQPKIEVTDGDLVVPSSVTWAKEGSDNQIIKYTNTDISSDASTLKIKGAEVRVKPDFEGPIEITVSGSAGAEGTVVVAEAKKPVKISAENVKDIVIGQANQKVADIVITETAKDMILDTDNHKDIVIGLEEGYKFSAKPNVTVEEGNLEIDSSKLQNNDSELKLVVKYGSTKASKIRISDVTITALRYVPVGPVKAELVGAAVENGALKTTGGSNALVDWATDKSMGDVVIANCVTPAEGVSAQFRIGSNVYSVNGVAKIMDVAPYIKDNRTYVPIRFLAYALGVTENDVVWDAETSTATFTKGDKVVVLTIGSTTITVNGEAQTMDVAPEIVNNRTMLPARFVAEGLGSTVAWDGATSTVYVQQ